MATTFSILLLSGFALLGLTIVVVLLLLLRSTTRGR